MKNNSYSSYNQIDKQLEILNIERKIAKQKIISSVEKAKDSLIPFSEEEDLGIGKFISKIPFAFVGKFILPFAINYFLKRKKD